MSIKKASLKGVNWALAAIITLLGFVGLTTTGCVEYGSPYADYKVKGTVVNKATQKPIEGIQVGYYDHNVEPGVPLGDKSPAKFVKTNSKGEFLFTLNPLSEWIPFQMIDNVRVLPVYAQDVDGELNGLYESTYILVDFTKAIQTKKSKNWYEGEFTATLKFEISQSE